MTNASSGDRRHFNLSDSIMFHATPAGEELIRAQHERIRSKLPDLVPEWTGLQRNSLGFTSFQTWVFSNKLGPAISGAETDAQPVLPILFRAPEDPFHIDDPVAVRLNEKGLQLVLEDVLAHGVPENLELTAAGATFESVMPFSTMVRAMAAEMYNGNPSLPVYSTNFDFLSDGRHVVTEF